MHLAVDFVIAHVERGVETALVAEFMGHLGIEVIEIIARIEFGVLRHGRPLGFVAGGVVESHDGGNDKKFGIGTAEREAERGALLDNGSLKIKLGRDKPNREIAVELAVVTVILRNIEDGTESSAKACGERALVKGDILDGVCIECREEASHVGNIIERHTVEQEKVFVGTTATDIHAAVAFAATLHTRHELQSFNEVGLAEHHRHGLDFLHGHLHSAHLRRACVAGSFGGDGNLAERHRGFEFNIEFTVAVKVEVKSLGLIAHKGDLEGHSAATQGEGIMAIKVGDGTLSATGIDDGGADEGLAGASVGDGAADCGSLCQDSERE